MSSAIRVVDRDRIEKELARLRSELNLATARLESLRTSGPEPRGFLPGLLVGGLVVAAGVAWFAYVITRVIGRI